MEFAIDNREIASYSFTFVGSKVISGISRELHALEKVSPTIHDKDASYARTGCNLSDKYGQTVIKIDNPKRLLGVVLHNRSGIDYYLYFFAFESDLSISTVQHCVRAVQHRGLSAPEKIVNDFWSTEVIWGKKRAGVKDPENYVQHWGDHPGMANTLLRDEAISLLAQFAHHDDARMLSKAIASLRQALSLEPPPHLDRPLTLNKLGCALKTQHDISSDLSILKEAIGYHRECFQYRPGGHENGIQTLNDLAIALRALRVSVDDMDAGNEAIALLWEAITTRNFPANIPLVRMRNSREPLASSKRCWQQSYSQTSKNMRSLHMNWHACSYDETFPGLEKSIGLFQRLYTLYMYDPPSFPSEIDLLGVANAFRRRFELKRGIDDINFAIMVLETLRAATNGVHTGASVNLAICLSSKFEVVPSLGWLDQAFRIHESLLKLPPDAMDIKSRVGVLHDKGFIQQYRFRRLQLGLKLGLHESNW
ncbi:hypothetical protein DFS33DRAFT_1456299 [Desarmillaria ectypa]|nr:hypothetical protein DFS33DRAFT_1456299 [Desarmillaria ectypa]